MVADRSGSFLETVFGFLVAVSPFVPVVAVMANLWGGFGRGLPPPPNHCDVSEANSFVAPQHSYPQPESYPQARRFRLSDFRYMQDIRIYSGGDVPYFSLKVVVMCHTKVVVMCRG